MAKINEVDRAIVAGASLALKLREKNPQAYNEEIIQEVVKSLKETKSNID